MPILGRSLLDTRTLSKNDIEEIFLKADGLAPLVKSMAARRTNDPFREECQWSAVFSSSQAPGHG
jgi:hypothetical protein